MFQLAYRDGEECVPGLFIISWSIYSIQDHDREVKDRCEHSKRGVDGIFIISWFIYSIMLYL